MNIDKHPPAPMRIAGFIAIAQSLAGIGYALLLIIREMRGVEDVSIVYETDNANTAVGAGTAIFFLIVFGTVCFGALRMMRGKRWGRGPVVMLEILLLPISITMFSAGATLLGAVTIATAIAGLVLVFCPASVQWAARQYQG